MSEVNLTATQIQDLIVKVKSGMERSAGVLESMPQAMFTHSLRLIGNTLPVAGIKVQSLEGNALSAEDMINQLELGPVLVFEMHFPDGSKYETVTRWRKGDAYVNTYARRI